MPHVSRFPQSLLGLAVCLLIALPGLAQLTVGSSNTATADPTVPRPHTTPCVVQLYSNFQFADFSPKPFTFTPAAGCLGPWAFVVLEADFACTSGRHLFSTAKYAIGHTSAYIRTPT